MGYTLPEWADEVLDYIGISFPNVDEDDYREMATGLREFAESIEDHGAEAHRTIQRLLSSGEGAAADALEAHWARSRASTSRTSPTSPVPSPTRWTSWPGSSKG